MRQRQQKNFRETQPINSVTQTILENAQDVRISGVQFHNNSYSNNQIDLKFSITGTYSLFQGGLQSDIVQDWNFFSDIVRCPLGWTQANV
jgi:hypothetical protein